MKINLKRFYLYDAPYSPYRLRDLPWLSFNSFMVAHSARLYNRYGRYGRVFGKKNTSLRP